MGKSTRITPNTRRRKVRFEEPEVDNLLTLSLAALSLDRSPLLVQNKWSRISKRSRLQRRLTTKKGTAAGESRSGLQTQHSYPLTRTTSFLVSKEYPNQNIHPTARVERFVLELLSFHLGLSHPASAILLPCGLVKLFPSLLALIEKRHNCHITILPNLEQSVYRVEFPSFELKRGLSNSKNSLIHLLDTAFAIYSCYQLPLPVALQLFLYHPWLFEWLKAKQPAVSLTMVETPPEPHYLLR